ncbi:F-box/WD-40 repeat-containing protein At5g21040 [Ziziphus jujuba]|uniref:F-box/WD-40 repeat-containing protein At5g21040 n=1 Tax=Ziziphus jujuba TaxID=326968 RepID=A0A6P3ZEW8_ZIZJJ|nr:F-box/WD-40 repeat-containing protein At5g21040 [Ziziphus jujuba]XP_015873295.2 F-box/WD-40 repeat-containing protein At5g21040 [Ziziphus jujuba]
MAFECQESIEVSEKLVDYLEDYCEEGSGSNQFAPNTKIESIEISEVTSDIRVDTERIAISKPGSEYKSKKGISEGCSGKTFNEVYTNCRRSIADLPPALISEILNCLGPKELGIISCVSRNLCSLASEHHVWKEFYCERWGLPSIPEHLDSEISEKSWKEIFVERDFRSKTFMGRYSIDVLYGHTEAVRTVFLLASAKLIFTSGYDSVVRMWDMEEGLAIASSRPLGCTIRAVAADTKLLVAGGTDGFINCWRAVEGHPHLFEIRGPQNQNVEFRLWEHEGPITSLALDLTRIYSGSWDMTVRVWDRTLLKCVKVLRHNDWVWGLVPHDTTVASTSGSDVYVWDTASGARMTVIRNAHAGNTYSIARSHTGDFLFTGGEDGAIHMFEISSTCHETNTFPVATWMPHSGPVYSLAFEFPWLVSASSDGKLSLVDVRKLLRCSKQTLGKSKLKVKPGNHSTVEPPQRMLHGFGNNLFSVDIGADRIVCGGEEGVIRIWNFSQALEIEQRVRALKGIRLENRMRRRKLQLEISSKGGRNDQCSFAAKKNSVNSDRSGVWYNKRGTSGKLKA